MNIMFILFCHNHCLSQMLLEFRKLKLCFFLKLIYMLRRGKHCRATVKMNTSHLLPVLFFHPKNALAHYASSDEIWTKE